jgi:hypothetical protein
MSSNGRQGKQKTRKGPILREEAVNTRGTAEGLSLPSAQVGGTSREDQNSSSLVNRRIPNGTYGGVRGRGLGAPSYSIETTE